MSRTIISVAVSPQNSKKVESLKKQISELLVVTPQSSNYQVSSQDLLANELATKAGLGNFLPTDRTGAVFFCDPCLYSVDGSNPIDNFVEPNADIAMVPYNGTYHYPQGHKRDTYNSINTNYNSSFIWFKNHDIARAVSTPWLAKYMERTGEHGILKEDALNKHDESALMEVLASGQWTHTGLDRKWNNWYKHEASDLFRQEYLENLYPHNKLILDRSDSSDSGGTSPESISINSADIYLGSSSADGYGTTVNTSTAYNYNGNFYSFSTTQVPSASNKLVNNSSHTLHDIVFELDVVASNSATSNSTYGNVIRYKKPGESSFSYGSASYPVEVALLNNNADEVSLTGLNPNEEFQLPSINKWHVHHKNNVNVSFRYRTFFTIYGDSVNLSKSIDQLAIQNADTATDDASFNQGPAQALTAIRCFVEGATFNIPCRGQIQDSD